ncbi:MAG: hypothetical protein ACTSRA_17980 [Promethearchaeota archaeon]
MIITRKTIITFEQAVAVQSRFKYIALMTMMSLRILYPTPFSSWIGDLRPFSTRIKIKEVNTSSNR